MWGPRERLPGSAESTPGTTLGALNTFPDPQSVVSVPAAGDNYGRVIYSHKDQIYVQYTVYNIILPPRPQTWHTRWPDGEGRRNLIDPLG